MTPTRTRILFFSEAVTLAHVARPLVLAQALPEDRYERHFACPAEQARWIEGLPFRHWGLNCISSTHFLGALGRGAAPYSADILRRYVEQDLSILDEVQPKLVVGDFRLSLSVSARLRAIPYIAISNAYWSPHCRQDYVAPSLLPFTRWTGAALATVVFRLVRPLAFAMHARPFNRLRRHYRLPGLGPDLRRVYTDADYTLYADVPELFPAQALPGNHRYLGPILWSPPVAPPEWWDKLPPERPRIYMTLGSSGVGSLLPEMLEALADLPVLLMVATAGQRCSMDRLPANAYLADYLSGAEAAARSRLVVCNGGSPTTQQALAAGVPVIGIASNLDQFLNMQPIVSRGAGRLLRADLFRKRELRQAVVEMLDDPRFTHAAQEIRSCFARYSAGERFRRVVEEIEDASVPARFGAFRHLSVAYVEGSKDRPELRRS